ncbi:SH2 domain-containing protein [Trichonephila clavipes]|nr:SH2 domain-containing protein [Trichonephila clavipes]
MVVNGNGFRTFDSDKNYTRVNVTVFELLHLANGRVDYGDDRESDFFLFVCRTIEGEVVHYSIVKLNDLFYFNDFPFPYLESIVLYYKKYKFKDTRLTQQAVLSPYIKSQRSKRISGYLKLDTVRESERDSHV